VDIVNSFSGKNVLITGGLGFIGSSLACRLVCQETRVTLVDSLIPEYGGNLFNITDIADRVTVNISDVRDEYSMKYLVQGKDYLFNLAGQTSHMDSMQNPQADLEINALAQLFILEACRKYNPAIKIVFASTRQIYGKPDYLPVDENHPIRPVDVNGINKMAGEWYHILYNNVHGIRACALRLTNTFGPRMRIKDARQTFLGIWVRSLIDGNPFEVWGGQQLRDYNYVEDVVDAMLLAAISEESNGRVFNLGGDERISLEDTAALLVAVHQSGGYQLKKFPEERKQIDIGDYFSDYTLINKSLGWRPQTSLKKGFRLTLDYYHQHLKNYL
jgi:nucleoside-diphosphate-sugar epimerase